MPQVYDLNDVVRCPAVFTDPITTTGTVHDTAWYGIPANDLTLVDPTTILFKVQTPAGTESTLTYGVDAAVVKSSTGKYYSDVTASQAGVWTYRWESSSTYGAAREQTFQVRSSEFT